MVKILRLSHDFDSLSLEAPPAQEDLSILSPKYQYPYLVLLQENLGAYTQANPVAGRRTIVLRIINSTYFTWKDF